MLNALTNAYTGSNTVLAENMKFEGFNRDSGNRKKCERHRLSIADIESVFSRPTVILPDKENPQGERRFRAIGTTVEGRKASWFSRCATTQMACSFAHQRPLHAQERG